MYDIRACGLATRMIATCILTGAALVGCGAPPPPQQPSLAAAPALKATASSATSPAVPGAALSPASPKAELDFNMKSGFIEVPREHGNPGAGMLKLYYELYERCGSRNKPLIALHGGPGAAMPFGTIVARSPLGEALLPHYRILYFDQRGAGKSAIGLTAEQRRASLKQVSLSQNVEDIEALRKAVFPGHPKVTLLGASWGSYLGLAYAAKYRHRTAALMLGSLEAISKSLNNVCATINDRLTVAMKEHPELLASVERVRKLIENKKVVWHDGKPDRYVLKPAHLLEILLPFAVKARFAQTKAVLDGIAARHPRALGFLDSLQDIGPETHVALGGSLAGATTFCSTFVDYAALKKLATAGLAREFCDERKMAKALMNHCMARASKTQPINLEGALSRLDMPALLFAGRMDPLVPWRATEHTAKRMKNATFVLVRSGGHTPIKAGGTCFAAIMSQFATDPARVDASCLK